MTTNPHRPLEGVPDAELHEMYRRAFRQLGFSDEAIERAIAGPEECEMSRRMHQPVEGSASPPK
jgi:hypothetical protein